MVSYPSRLIKLAVFFEPNAEESLRPPNVGVVGVVVTRDVVDDDDTHHTYIGETKRPLRSDHNHFLYESWNHE